MPIGTGSSQQCIFFIRAGHTALLRNLHVNIIRLTAGTKPLVTLKFWVYDSALGIKKEVWRHNLDVAVQNEVYITALPFPVGEKSRVWLEATTDTNDTEVTADFDVVEISNT